jgi:uncharacterized protein YecE (DUF72 family)
MGVYLGSMGWSYKQWGLFSGVKAGNYLSEYARHFNSVEVNNTFYRIPKTSYVENWTSRVPDGFRFAVKFPRGISHSAGLKADQGMLEAFLSRMPLFGDKLGPLLIQLPSTFKSHQSEGLEDFLGRLPLVNRYAVEFRHESWFNEDTYSILRDNEVALVNVEHPSRPSADVQTTDFTYIRLEGDRKTVKGESGDAELDRADDNIKWADRISGLAENGRDVYCYLSKHYSGYPPGDISQITAALGAKEL